MALIDISGSTSPAPGTVQLVTDPCDPSKKALSVAGTNVNDKIEIKLGSAKSPGKYQVKINGVTVATVAAGPTVNRVIAYGLDGNDEITVDTRGRTVPAWLFGGNGNDTLAGNIGNDVLVGGNHNDVLKGGNGRNLLIGGNGSDKATGGTGEDILIAGFTDYDNNLSALCKIMDEWTSAAPVATRVSHLRGPAGGGTAGGLNALYFLNNSTVDDDVVKDELKGDGGADWFFARTAGPVLDTLDFKAAEDFFNSI